MKNQRPPAEGHGASELTSVVVSTYNAELRDVDGFMGDRATNRAFRGILDELRERLRLVGEDPLGEDATSDLSKKKLDKLLMEGDPEAAGVVHGAIEAFAVEFATVIKRFLKLQAWRDAQKIVVGGGLRASRIGELVIGRTSVLLKADGRKIDLVPIHHHPDEAGLVGAVHLAPAALLDEYDALLAVDIGGSNVRAGVVQLPPKKKKDLARCAVSEMELWRYADEAELPTRDQAVERIGEMLLRLAGPALEGQKLAPFIGLACPGLIGAGGQIERGGQNLPGNWESSRFNLPSRIREMIPQIGKRQTTIVMHNDAVVQGLSELPFLDPEIDHWGVMTIGTGLGNAVFTGRRGRTKTKSSGASSGG